MSCTQNVTIIFEKKNDYNIMTIYGPNLPHFQERQLNLYLLVDIISTTLEVLMMSFKIITFVSSIMLWTYGGGGRGV